MSDVTVPIGGLGSGSAPLDYPVTGDQEITVLGIRAVFDGTGAAGNFLPCVQYLTGTGNVMIQTVGSSVLAGGSTDASFFPRVKRAATTPGTFNYYQVIAALEVTNTLVAQWHLTDGTDPFADTSGNSVGGNAHLLLQDFGAPLNEANPDGPLASLPAGPSVSSPWDGSGPFNYLHTTLAPPSRFEFAGNLPYTVVAWVKPVAGANTHTGGVVGNVQVTNFGTPAEVDNGWQIALKSSTLECTVSRYANVTVGHTPDTVSLGAMDTTKWTMIAMTYDGATLSGYANGSLVGTVASAGAIGDGRDAYVFITQAGPNGLSEWYKGAVSEISVWASTLTANDLATLYAAHTN